jgi:hypothetical protein
MNWGIHTDNGVPDGLELDLLTVDQNQEIDWFQRAFRPELDEWARQFRIVPTYHWGLLFWFEP